MLENTGPKTDQNPDDKIGKSGPHSQKAQMDRMANCEEDNTASVEQKTEKTQRLHWEYVHVDGDEDQTPQTELQPCSDKPGSAERAEIDQHDAGGDAETMTNLTPSSGCGDDSVDDNRKDGDTMKPQEEIENLKREIENLKNQLSSKDDELAQASEELIGQKEKSENLQHQLKTSNMNCEKVEQSLNDKVTEIESLQKKQGETSVLLASREKELAQAREQVANQIQKNESLQTDLKDITLKFERSQNEATTLYNQRTEKQVQMKQLTDELKALKQDGRAMKGSISTLERELKSQMDLVADYQRRLQNMKVAHERNFKELETKLSNAAKKQNNTMDGLRKDAKELQRKLKTASDELQKTDKYYNESLERLRDLEEQAGCAKQLLITESQLKRDVSSKCEQVESLKKTLKDKEAEITRLSDSLSKEWSTKVSADESNTENISVSNRPMMLKSEFENICSNEWLDAKTDLDEIPEMEESEKIMFLCEIPLKAEKSASKQFHKMMSDLKVYLSQPLTCTLVKKADDNGSIQEQLQQTESMDGVRGKDDNLQKDRITTRQFDHKSTSTFSQELLNALGDHLRINADKTDMSQISQDLCADLSKDKQGTAWIGEVLENSQIQKYVTACSLLAWKMITQRPPMQFSSDGTLQKFEEKSQEPHFGSDDPLHKDSVVMYYVTPAMYHSDSLMVKGRVVTKIVS